MQYLVTEGNAPAGVLVGGMPNALYKVSASLPAASGQWQREFTQYTYGFNICAGQGDPIDLLLMQALYPADITGRSILAAKAGSALGMRALLTHLHEGDEVKDVQIPCGGVNTPCKDVVGTGLFDTRTDYENGKVTFGAVEGAASIAGDYRAPYTLAAGVNVIDTKGSATVNRQEAVQSCSGGCYVVDKYKELQSGSSTLTAYGVEIQMPDLPVMVLDGDGLTVGDYEVPYTIVPAEYTAGSAVVYIYRDGGLFEVLPAELSGLGFIKFSAGSHFNVESNYEVEVVLNEGSSAEIKTERKRLHMLTFDLTPSEPDTVSADDLAYSVSNFSKASAGIEELGLKVKWLLEGQGGSLTDVYSTEVEGVFFNNIAISTHADATYSVKLSIEYPDEKLQPTGVSTGTITVVPGVVHSVDMSASRTVYAADGAGTVDVALVARDQFGNLVQDGTSVSWFLEGEGELVEGTGYTINGAAQMTVRAGRIAGTETLKANVDGLESSVQLTALPVNLSIVPEVDTVKLGGAPVRVDVYAWTEAPDGVTEGAVVDIVASLGKVPASVALEGGHAVAYLEPIGYYGTSHVRAMVGRSYTDATVEIMPRDGLNIQPTRKIIVGDQPQDGTMQVEAPDGTLVDVPYYTSTDLQITGGEPGKVVVVELEDNRLPVAWYTMNGLDGTVARDYTFLHDGVTTGVSEDAERYVAGGASYRFDGNGSIEVPDSQLLRMQSMKFTADVLAEGSGVQRIIEKGSNYALWVEHPSADMLTAVFEVKTADGVYRGSITAPVAANKFAHVVAAHRAGEIYVEIDGVHSVTQAMGVINYNSEPVVIGRSLTGNLDNVKVWDLSFAAMSSFSNGSERIEVTLDETGSASVPVYSTDAMGSAIAKMQKAPMEKGRIQAAVVLLPAVSISKVKVVDPTANAVAAIVNLTMLNGNAMKYLNEFVVKGFVLGEVDGLFTYSGAGDIIAGGLVWGDVRDGGKSLFKIASCTATRYDYAILSLSAFGIVTTASTFAGHPELDASVSVLRTSIKAYKGTRLEAPVLDAWDRVSDLISKHEYAEALAEANKVVPTLKRMEMDPAYKKLVMDTAPGDMGAMVRDARGAHVVDSGKTWLDVVARIETELGEEWMQGFAKFKTRCGIPNDITDPRHLKVMQHFIMSVHYAVDKGALKGGTAYRASEVVAGMGVLMFRQATNTVMNKVAWDKSKRMVDAVFDYAVLNNRDATYVASKVQEMFVNIFIIEEKKLEGFDTLLKRIGNWHLKETGKLLTEPFTGDLFQLHFLVHGVHDGSKVLDSVRKIEVRSTGHSSIDIEMMNDDRIELKNMVGSLTKEALETIKNQFMKSVEYIGPGNGERLYYYFRIDADNIGLDAFNDFVKWADEKGSVLFPGFDSSHVKKWKVDSTGRMKTSWRSIW